jgi:hypothetical protein
VESTYSYRIIKSSWGIAIDITAEAVPLAHYSGTAAEEVEQGLWLAVETGWQLSPDERRYLATGLRLVSQGMQRRIVQNGPIVVRVIDLRFNPTDYQEEGLAYALAGWMAQTFDFPFSPPHALFNREKNRYEFSLPQT